MHKTARIMHSRWVEVGTVKEKFIHYRNWGVPHGVEIYWRGTNRAQEFFRWEHLFSLLQERTNLSGLRLVAIASDAKRNLYGRATLRVLFERRPARPAASAGIAAPGFAAPGLPADTSFALPA